MSKKKKNRVRIPPVTTRDRHPDTKCELIGIENLRLKKGGDSKCLRRNVNKSF